MARSIAGSTGGVRLRVLWGLAGLVGLAGLGTSGCAHHGPPAPEGPVQRWQEAATRVPNVTFEDEFVEARLVFQALPLAAPQRLPLRANLLRYLLAPIWTLNADRLRHEAAELNSTDVFDRAFDSLRDAVSLFDPSELAAMAAGPPVGATSAASKLAAWERQGLAQAARLSLGLFSPRGAETQSALALAVLMTVEPQNPVWAERFDRLLSWSDEVRTSSERGQPPSPTAIDLLQVVLSDWPAPFVADRLAALYKSRQKQFFGILKPLPTDEDARQSLRDLLLAHGQEMQRTVPNVAVPYLRCGRIAEASAAVAPLRDSPGDDPELRAMLVAAAGPTADRESFLKLARRFLPRIELLQGTATDNPDLLVAFRVLQGGLERTPADADLLLLSAELAKLMSSPFLATRELEEAETILGQQPRTAAVEAKLAQISQDLLELYFLRLRLSLDPERGTPPSADEVARVRQRSAIVSQRAPKSDPGELRVRDAQIDFELARSYMNAGMVDQAEPLFLRAQSSNPAVNPEITAEFGNFLLKRGSTEQAGKVLRDGLAALRGSAHANDTITGVEGQSRIERLLGEALDRQGDRSGAEEAWQSSATGWGQLTMEYRRRANTSRESEARFEVGRTLYLLGRHAEGIQSFDEAIEQDGDRDQTYIDSIAFLVEHGEVDGALAIYRRALAKPDRSVSEYVKVYASLWIVDLTRRILKQPDMTALAFLGSLDTRHPEIRPQRGSKWYRQLAAFSIGRLSYARLLAEADTNGKRAEVYFYQAMRQLADGKAEQAQSLWQKVIDTRMVSFFEFEMASRYLRGGAPSNAPTLAPSGAPGRPLNTETI